MGIEMSLWGSRDVIFVGTQMSVCGSIDVFLWVLYGHFVGLEMSFCVYRDVILWV